MNTSSSSYFGKTLPAFFLLAAALSLSAATVRYVNVNSTNPVPPFTDWSIAATNIQAAVDVAVAGDLILVTNGVYETGARAVYGMSNRVAVAVPVTVRSVNGPALTQIVGYQVPGTTNGAAAVRCVYLTNGAVLAGFTVTYGATQTAGDVIGNQHGGGVWCEGWSAVVSNCVLMGNSAGGTYGSGGGAYNGTLNNCVLTGNSAVFGGGGAANCALNNCTLTGNLAGYGGGAYNCRLTNCTLTGNSGGKGGGVYIGLLNNCIVYYNNAHFSDANYSDCTLNYCCTTPLPASPGNLAEEPQLASVWHLSAGSPCISRGSAAYASSLDLDGEPWANPPSIGCDEYWSGSVTGALSVAVLPAYTNVAVGFGLDLQAVIGGRVSGSRWDFGDGSVASNRPWASHAWAAAGEYVVELRSYNESYPAGVSATVTIRVLAPPVHYVALTSANPLPPFSSWATAARNIQDAVDAAVPGALVWVSNGIFQTGIRAVWGMGNRVVVTKPVTVRSVNGPGVTSIVGSGPSGPAAVRCVYLTDGAVLAGFTLANGGTQTSGDFDYRIQSGGGVWCEGLSAVVSNCVLAANSADSGGGAYGGTLNNCVFTGNSANNYDGGGAHLGNLNNCRLTGNSSGRNGGGASWSTLNNCVLTDNSADAGGGTWSSTLNNCMLTSNSARDYGGGASHGTLNNCTFTGNSAERYGGGFYGGFLVGTLNNCTLTGNSANIGGGAYHGVLNNCIVYYNSGSLGNSNYYGGVLNYCCTTPLPSMGPGNRANEPSFVNTNGWSNLRLQSNSPGVNAGNNAFAPGPTDLDANPRISGGTVDMGAYEFQFSDPFRIWLAQYGLPTDGSADFTDPDGDTRNNWQEWICGTVPTITLSVLRLLTPQTVGTNLAVSWQSVSGKSYFLQRSTGLGTNASFLPLATNLAGQAGTIIFTDTNAAPAGPRFYRVGVQ